MELEGLLPQDVRYGDWSAMRKLINVALHKKLNELHPVISRRGNIRTPRDCRLLDRVTLSWKHKIMVIATKERRRFEIDL